MALHFVGFRDGSELYRAMRIFGIPDFVHVKVDARLFFGGELDPLTDTVVFAEAAGVSSSQEARNKVECDIRLGKGTVDDSDMSATGRWHMRPLTGKVPW